MAARRLTHGEQDKGDAGEADEEEDRAPVAAVAQDQAAEQKRQRRAQIDAHRVDADGRPEFLAGKVIGDEGVGRGRERGFADADAHAREKQLGEVAGEAAEGGHGAPEDEAGGDQSAAGAAVGEAVEGQAAEGVEDGEGQPAEQTHLSISNTQVALDGVDDEGEDLAVYEVEDVDHHQHADYVPGVGEAGGEFRGSGGRGHEWLGGSGQDSMPRRKNPASVSALRNEMTVAACAFSRRQRLAEVRWHDRLDRTRSLSYPGVKPGWAEILRFRWAVWQDLADPGQDLQAARLEQNIPVISRGHDVTGND